LKEYWENIFDMNLHLLQIVLSQLVYIPVGRLSSDELVFPILGGEKKQLKNMNLKFK
jgi:hypothetical protein